MATLDTASKDKKKFLDTKVGDIILGTSGACATIGLIVCPMIISGYCFIKIGLGFARHVAHKGVLVYDGAIDDKQVEYREYNQEHVIDSRRIRIGGFYTLISGSSYEVDYHARNVMTVKEGNTTFIFEDILKEELLYWETSLPHVEAKLEGVIIKEGEQTYGYSLDNIQIGFNSDKEHAARVFEKANTMYNDLRGRIRKELQEKDRASQASIEEKLH